MSFAQILPSAPLASPAHADAVLELAFLVTAVDGRLAQEELAAFRELAQAVRGKPVSEAEVAALFELFMGSVKGGKDTIAARVRALAPTLPEDLRELAFRVAIGLALVDKDAAAEEDALVGVLFESLGLDEARAEALAHEVRLSFGATR